ncbi:MAG: S9 family peptidase [Rhodanobacteraceae bacterium]|jgi:dipeptidyl aminopeptidase/acylaminoacyl peptidase|nr:MAG: S9 family peptidase [Rhodanobacteraceae bacterium]
MPAFTRCLALLLAGFIFVPLARADAPPAQSENARIEHILAQRAKVKDIPVVALSWDGQRLAWVVSHDDKTTLMLASWNGQNARPAGIPGDCREQDLRWAPRANELAVLTRCKVDPSNTKPIRGAIWLIDVQRGQPPRKLADIEGFAQGMQWSRDGQRIAFLYVPGATRLPYATASGNPRVGVIGETDEQVERIAQIPVAGGAVEVLTPENLYVYEFRLSPIGNRLAYTAAPPPGDNNWWTAKLYVQDARAGAAPKMIVDPATVEGPLHGLQMALPRWSPDAARIVFIGGLMSDRGATGGDLYGVPASGGTPIDLTEGIKVTPAWFTFLGPRSLLVNQIASGKVQVTEYTLDGNVARQTRTWFTAPGRIGDGRAELSVALSDKAPLRIAYAADSFDEPPEVHAGLLATRPPPAVTTINADLKPEWGKTQSVEWNHGGFRVQGWLMYPARYDAHRRYPMIVYVHGGPSSATLPAWRNNATALSQFGYFVLMPNPRGSFGEGEAFAQAIRNQMGYGDLDDILAGVDKVEKLAPIDNARLGMTGWSYGGFMSMFAPTRTHRFKAVVAGAGLSDWQSYYGENQIDQWMIPFFGASLYDDPAAYAKSSAINFIRNTQTPALIVVGERDEECPAPQSFEYWHALKTLGVPTTLVVYANQGHHIADHVDQEDILRRTLDWFGKYLSASQ